MTMTPCHRYRTLCIALVLASLAVSLSTVARADLPQALVWEAVVRGSDEGELRWPVDVAAAVGGELLVADAHPARLVLFEETTDGSWSIRRVVELPEPPASLAAREGDYLLSMRSSGGLFVVDRETWKPKRVPLPAGILAGHIAVAENGDLLVLDRASGEVLHVTLEPDATAGNVRSRTPARGYLKSVLVRAGGAVLGVDPASAAIRPLGAEPSDPAAMKLPAATGNPSWPVDALATSTGELYVLDRHRGRVYRLDGNGQPNGIGSREGREPGLLSYPAALAQLPDGRIAIADQGNGRVQLFRIIAEDGP